MRQRGGISWKTLGVAANLLVEAFGGDPIEGSKLGIEQHAIARGDEVVLATQASAAPRRQFFRARARVLARTWLHAFGGRHADAATWTMNKQIHGLAFSDAMKAQLDNAGLTRATLESVTPEGQPFGDAAIIFRVGGMLLRFVRDRGQVFLEIAAVSAPAKFYQYDDIEIAMGGRTIDQVLAKVEPEDIAAVSSRLHDPLDKTDATGVYGAGTGWTNDTWNKFNAVQQKAALRSDGSDGKVANRVDSGTYQSMG